MEYFEFVDKYKEVAEDEGINVSLKQSKNIHNKWLILRFMNKMKNHLIIWINLY
ncbi:hypothetical protein [Cytobacillus sp. IB215665]|uniref:hypothetical protein n=1 Tax=Cytobacillus sp. IB215665 TaxID=3097357 RepID=UPI002A0D4CAE|nr:hypothetical protein [Cytobacillus sp. IB215665]MDX8366903.1 hypothetical protein [Cytobacillus sp. IB215665]